MKVHCSESSDRKGAILSMELVLVLPIFLVHQHDHAAGFELGDDFRYRGESHDKEQSMTKEWRILPQGGRDAVFEVASNDERGLLSPLFAGMLPRQYSRLARCHPLPPA